MEYHLGREKYENNTGYFFSTHWRTFMYVLCWVSDIILKGFIDWVFNVLYIIKNSVICPYLALFTFILFLLRQGFVIWSMLAT